LNKGIFFRKDTGVFLGNPMLFGKGDWNDIRQLRMTVIYGKYGIKVSTEVDKEDSGQETVLNESKDLLEKNHIERNKSKPKNAAKQANAHSTVIPGLTPEKLEWLREIVEANTVQISILGMFTCSFHSVLQLLNTLSL
jgi:hypothetical protein